ncbi:MAG: globin [Acidimicrobiales bacterium]|nr:globin [Acidimicrobiales bacterium]
MGAVTDDATPEITFYDRVGGQAFFDRLVDEFYDGIATDPVLLPLYPDQTDLAPARRRLALFLGQYWGGPSTYHDERGHPRLRMRHMPFTVGPLERDRWLVHMTAAVDVVTRDLPDADEAIAIQQVLLGYFVPAAEHLRNDTGLPISSSDPRR